MSDSLGGGGGLSCQSFLILGRKARACELGYRGVLRCLQPETLSHPDPFSFHDLGFVRLSEQHWQPGPFGKVRLRAGRPERFFLWASCM